MYIICPRIIYVEYFTEKRLKEKFPNLKWFMQESSISYSIFHKESLSLLPKPERRIRLCQSFGLNFGWSTFFFFMTLRQIAQCKRVLQQSLRTSLALVGATWRNVARRGDKVTRVTDAWRHGRVRFSGRINESCAYNMHYLQESRDIKSYQPLYSRHKTPATYDKM